MWIGGVDELNSMMRIILRGGNCVAVFNIFEGFIMSNRLESSVKVGKLVTIRDLKDARKQLSHVGREDSTAINLFISYHFKGKLEDDELYLIELIQDQAKLLGDTSLASKAKKALQGGKVDIRMGVAIDGEDLEDLSDSKWRDWKDLSISIVSTTIELLEG